MRQGIPIYILALNSDSIGIYPSIPPASQKRIMFLSLILSFFSYKYQRTNKIQNERYFHHRYLSFYFNLSLMIFRTVYRYLTFIRLSFTDDTTYLLSISYLHPYLISLTYLCFLTAGKTHYKSCKISSHKNSLSHPAINLFLLIGISLLLFLNVANAIFASTEKFNADIFLLLVLSS